MNNPLDPSNFKKNSDEEDEGDDEFNIKTLEDEASPEVKALLDVLSADDEFNSELDALLANLDPDNIDLTYLQTNLILLLQNMLGRLHISGKDKIKELLKSKEKQIGGHLKELSMHLMMTRSQTVKEFTKGIDTPKDKYAHLNTVSKTHIKQVMRRFAVYEVYKLMNPRRIAGETKRQHFMSNIITLGLRKAIKYEGETIEQVKKEYAPSVLKNLEKQHSRFKKGGIKGITV